MNNICYYILNRTSPAENIHNILFRRFESQDTAQVKALHVAALQATNAFVGSGQWDSDLDTIQSTYLDKGEFLIGVLDENVVAMGAYKYISEQIVEIKRMRVGPNLQGKGIGRHLLGLLEDSARDAGYQSVQLDTTVNQVAAQRLYVTSGYTEIRRETEGWPLETIFYQKSL